MFSDNDIKIAGDKPSLDIAKNARTEKADLGASESQIKAAKAWGKTVALKFIKDITESEIDSGESNLEMLAQRRMLLSFAASIGFETLSESETLGGFAQKSFLDTVQKNSPKQYHSAEDNGAFSFYYLAYRRGNDIERRIGQTFAMLCSHDGDPIYQELGEALYCWFLSVVKKAAEEHKILK